MRNLFIITVIAMACLGSAAAEAFAPYGVARAAVPVLNTPDIGSIFGSRDGRTLRTDHCGQVRALEFIALPGTPFRLLAEVRQGDIVAYRVETGEYPTPPSTALYVDSRLIEPAGAPPRPRPRRLPEQDEIVATLKSSLGCSYVWGSNLRQGVPHLLEMYYRGQFPSDEVQRLTLTGLDCSGLLYEATNGWTPRNTSSLVSYGRGVAIAGRGVSELAAMLQPLDLIVWNGHMVIVMDRETTIESRLKCNSPGRGGVVATPLRQRLAKLMQSRRPVDAWPAGGKQRDIFVVRRWYGL